MIRLFKLVFSLVVLLVLLLVADRLAARVAGQVVADRIKATQHLTSTPKVTIEGFPFLTQLIAGKYGHVDASATDLRRGEVRATAVDLNLYGVHVKAGDVLTQSVKAVPVDHADGSVLLSYADLDALLASKDVTVQPGPDGSVIVTGSVTVAGRTLKGSGQGSVQPVDGGLRVTVSHLEVAGVPAALTNALAGGLSFVIPTSSLPFGVTVDSAVATATGVALQASVGAFSIPVQ